jgi:hypothetical protein
MDQKAFVQFLIEAKKHGYAAGGEDIVTREADGSKSTRYEEGDFSFHDNYFGGEPFGGREVVWFKRKPYWMMVYYGSNDHDPKTLIPVLVKALSNPPQEMPVRGPQELIDGEFKYINKWEGIMEQFSGEETKAIFATLKKHE